MGDYFGGPAYEPNCPSTNNPCAPGDAQKPVDEAEYRSSLMVRTQSAVDRGRRISHQIGARPYRVFLVWQQRGDNRLWTQVHTCELMPVRVLTTDSVELVASDWGEDLIGAISLTEISPNQVDEDTLRGYLDGVDWGAKSTDRQFFYELQMQRRCEGQLKPQRQRYYPASQPFLDGERNEWLITIGQQNVPRSRDGVDQTVGTENADGTPLSPNGPRLVT